MMLRLLQGSVLLAFSALSVAGAPTVPDKIIPDEIKVPAGERTLEFKGLDFLQRWAIPNVFFHVTTAYAILRHNGVELGKPDFLGS